MYHSDGRRACAQEFDGGKPRLPLAKKGAAAHDGVAERRRAGACYARARLRAAGVQSVSTLRALARYTGRRGTLHGALFALKTPRRAEDL